MRIDRDTKRVYQGGVEIRLSPIQWRIVEYLAERPDSIKSNDMIISRCWPVLSDSASESALYNQVMKLRRKLGPGYIISHPGRGYSFW